MAAGSPYALRTAPAPRSFFLPLVCVGLIGLVSASPATAMPPTDETLAEKNRAAWEKFVERFWTYELDESPFLASSHGVRDADFRFPAEGPEVRNRRASTEYTLLKALRSLDTRELDEATILDIDVLARDLAMRLDEYKLGGHLMPIHQREGPQIWIPTFGDRMTFTSARDYEAYLNRLAGIPPYLEGVRAQMEMGLERGFAPPAVTLEGVLDQFDALLVDDAEGSLFFGPFKNFPAAVPPETREPLRERARAAIIDTVLPAYRTLRTYLENEYIPSTRSSIGALDLPSGDEFYAHRVRYFTTTFSSPQDVHQMGLEEVARIRRAMEQRIADLGYEGTFAEFIAFLRTDSQFRHDDAASLLTGYRDLCKRIDAILPRFFGKLPRAPYGVRAIPDHEAPRTTTAYYQPAPPDGTRPGWFCVNTYDLAARPSYEMVALALHEAVPGHHLQIALANELEGRPEFRKTMHFTAFVEGWALYAESLGTEMGLYSDPYDDFGRLSYEMWRALRLVVDTGIHQFGWTRDEAIQRMVENSALSRHNIEAEVDRYIAWPGQALAYKIGELKIQELRARAESELGDRFDLRAFHDQLLDFGALPLDSLETRTSRWIESRKNATSGTPEKAKDAETGR